MTALVVSVCRGCGWRGFPERVWCPRCGSDDVGGEPVTAGCVESATTLRRAAGRPVERPVPIATVRLAGGGRVVARLEGGGPEVAVDVEGGAPVARPPTEGEGGA